MKIYAIKDLTTDKIIYIGQTIQSGKKRFYDHFRAARDNLKTDRFHSFLASRKIEEFEFIILEDNIEDKELLNQREEYYIDYYDTINMGYNTYKQSNAVNLHPNPKKVLWYDNNQQYVKTFESIVAAEEETGVNACNISHCCNHLQDKTSQGWFRFEDDNTPLRIPERCGTSHRVQKLDPFTREVLHTYDSLKQAEETEGIIKGYLSFVCNGSKYSAKGFLYQFEEESLQKPYIGGKTVKTGVAQVDKNTKHVLARFLSCEDCANILGLSKQTILHARNHYPKISVGYIWVRGDKYKELLDKGEIIEDENTKIYY